MITKIRKAASPRKVLIVIILFSIFGFLYLCEWLQNSTEKLRVRQIFPAYECHRNNLVSHFLLFVLRLFSNTLYINTKK